MVLNLILLVMQSANHSQTLILKMLLTVVNPSLIDYGYVNSGLMPELGLVNANQMHDCLWTQVNLIWIDFLSMQVIRIWTVI